MKVELAVVDTAAAAVLVDSNRYATSMEAFGRLLDSQQELFKAQVDHLQRIVLAQCKLTGINPLSQEMAAEALSIKIGKRPRDLLNPKAVKYMQLVFSIKDTISKKESREISAICGATITQVREFFSGQRSRVRKLVRLSREKAVKLDGDRSISNKCLFISSSVDTVSQHVSTLCQHVPLNSVGEMGVQECVDPQVTTPTVATALEEKQLPIKAIHVPVGHSSCSAPDETNPSVSGDDRIFLDNIFNLMRKEETFSGQVKLMERVVQINDSSALYWFLTEGGISILATWLSVAALEEQTSLILVIFKVLCHLPLHKALPTQISVILQSVNKLRFYRTSDISNKARFLLSRWSKLFIKSQNMTRSSAMFCGDAQKEKFRNQRINEILSDEFWRSKVDIPGDNLATGVDSSLNGREVEHKPCFKLLPVSYDNTSRKDKGAVTSAKTKERRKVLMMEQPDCTSATRNMTVVRAVPSNLSRPISADDIQKAKMRAIIMQDKFGKDAAANEKCLTRVNDTKSLNDSQRNGVPPLSRSSNSGDEDKYCASLKIEKEEKPNNSNRACKLNEISAEVLKCDLCRWQRPPEVTIFCKWSVGTGEDSKEIEVQTQRNQREVETFYLNTNDIPSDPKDPWDVEMDFDDSLTPEVPTEQSAEADAGDALSYEGGTELSPCPPSETIDRTQGLPTISSVSDRTLEPDLELLAVLLKNPDVVFALTAGQGSGMNDAQTIALLDVLKNSGIGKSEEKPELSSLPSPTPPVERNGWREEHVIPDRVPVSRHLNCADGNVTSSPKLPSPYTPDGFNGNVQGSPMQSNFQLLQLPKAMLSATGTTTDLCPSSMPTSDVNMAHKKSLSITHHKSAAGFLPSHTTNDESVISNRRFNIGSPSGISFGSLSEAINLDQAHNHSSQSFSNISSFQPLHDVSTSHQPLLTERQKRFRSIPPSALQVGADLRSKPTAESWNSIRSGMTNSGCSYLVQRNEDRFSAPGMEDELGNSIAHRSSADVRLVDRYPMLGKGLREIDRMNRSWSDSQGHRNHHKPGSRWRNQDEDYRN